MKKRSFYMAQTGQIKNDTSRKGTFESITIDGKMVESEPELPENPSLLRLVLDSKPYQGRRVTTMGMAYSDEKVPGHTFFCYRLTMYCCAAARAACGGFGGIRQTQDFEKRRLGES